MLNKNKVTGIAVALAVAVTSLPLGSAFAAPLAPLPAITTPSAAPLANVVEVKSKRKKKIRRYNRRHRGYWVHRRYYPGPFFGGLVLGTVIANQGPYYVYRRGYRAPNAHVRYCYNRYRSYRAWDNTFQPYHGPRKQCRSPYWP